MSVALSEKVIKCEYLGYRSERYFSPHIQEFIRSPIWLFPNSTNKLEVERQQYDLLAYVRKKLNNYKISLDIKVNEELEKQYAYTPMEKYEKLKEKNPNIDLLRKTFDLDI